MYNPKSKKFFTTLNTYLFDDRRIKKVNKSQPQNINKSNIFHFLNFVLILVILYIAKKYL